jgi:hypothetical protein
MTYRKKHPEPLIVSAVVENKRASWNAETQKVARTDAERVLEAMIAEFGVQKAVRALDNQGFRGDSLCYLLGPLYEEAIRRRKRAQQSRAGASETL